MNNKPDKFESISTNCIDIPLDNRQIYKNKKISFGPLAYNLKSISKINTEFVKSNNGEPTLAELKSSCTDKYFINALEYENSGFSIYDEEQQKELYKRRLEDKPLITKLVTAMNINPFDNKKMSPTLAYCDIIEIHDYSKISPQHKKNINKLLKETDYQTKSFRYRDSKSLIKMSEAYFIDKNLTEKFKTETVTTPAGFKKPRFVGRDIYKLVEFCQKSEKHKQWCLKYMTEIDENGHPKNNAEDIMNFAYASVINHVLTEKYRNIQVETWWGGKQSKFSSSTIKQLVQLPLEKQKIIENNDTPSDIQYIEEAKSIDEEFYIELTQMKNLGKNSDKNRFNTSNASMIVHFLNEYNKDDIKKIIELKANDNLYRFNALEIEDVLQAGKINSMLTDILLQAETTDFEGNTYPKYQSDEILGIVKLSLLDKSLPYKIMYEQFPSDLKNQPMTDRFKRNNILVMSENMETMGVSILKYINEKDLEGVPKYNGNDISSLILAEKKAPNLANYMFNQHIKTNNGKKIQLFNPQIIQKVVEETINSHVDPDVVTKMFKTHFELENVEEFLYNSKDRKKIEKLFSNKNTFDFILTNQPKTTCSTNVSIPYVNDIYRASYTNSNAETIIIDFKLNEKDNPQIIAREYVKNGAYEKLVRREYSDGSKIVEKIQKGTKNEIQGYKKTFYNQDGIQMYSEVVIPSSKNGEYIINYYKRGGNGYTKDIIGTVSTNLTGTDTIVDISTKSTGDVSTKQMKQFSPAEYKSEYSIKNKSEKTLLKTKRSQIKLDKNHYLSYHNDDIYDIKINSQEQKIEVTKFDKFCKKIDVCELGSDVLDFNLLKLYRQLPGDYFFKIKQMKLKKVVLGGLAKKDNASYTSGDRTISISEKYRSNPFTFAHEFGHAMDNLYCNNLQNDKNLKKIFDKELLEYKENSSDSEGAAIDYFTTRRHKNDDNCLSEVIAETNAIISGLPNNDDSMGIRSILLQKHFPQTMSYIANRLDA